MSSDSSIPESIDLDLVGGLSDAAIDVWATFLLSLTDLGDAEGPTSDATHECKQSRLEGTSE